jgi:high affinity Mn2+ porin
LSLPSLFFGAPRGRWNAQLSVAMGQLAPRLAVLACIWLMAFTVFPARAQDPVLSVQDSSTEDAPSPAPDPLPIMFPHQEWSRLWLSGQANIISQWHPAFTSPYQGPHSLTPEAQDATSHVFTLFTGLRFSSTTELLCDVQETGGHGISEALGLAGFTNLDVVRNPTLSHAPYIARLMIHQIIPLGQTKIPAEQTPFSLFRELPERRIELRFGKFSLVDFFDVNSYGSDSNFQFMNWTVDNSGAYDYAADTRGYTYAAMFEYDDHWGTVRFAEALMPKVANGINLDADMARARAENVEFEFHRKTVRGQTGVLRLLSYVNHANMGVYRQAIDNYLAGLTPQPEITDHPLQTTIKYGFGANFEQPLNNWLGIFGRWGWNEGQHESYAYTEVDQTDQIGAAFKGTVWHRKWDRAGVVFVSNGISHDHVEYLALGGEGFLLGDGHLNYGRENIVETYYTLHAWRGIYPAFGVQHINNPGYNRDRGPVLVPTLRLHVEF